MKIPFSILPIKRLEGLSKKFLGLAELVKPFFPFLEMNLKQAKSEYTPTQYLAMCIPSSIIFFIIIAIILPFILTIAAFDKPIILGILVTIPITIFAFFQQALYPKLYTSRKIKDLERNLLPSLRAIMINLSSGVSLYEVLVAISNGPYGELSNEFKLMVKRINAGTPAVDAIEDSATKNPSINYRRALWQLSNGLKAGGDVTKILKEIIDGLSREQILQIENYGSQLNPMAMFYMLLAVVMPSLAITLLVALSSFISASGLTMKLMFAGIYVIVLFFQIMFLGLIRTRRPNLIET